MTLEDLGRGRLKFNRSPDDKSVTVISPARHISAFAEPTPTVAPQRTLSFSFGAETRRGLAMVLGFGSRRNRVWHQAKSTPTSSKASERPHGQANSMTIRTR